MARSVIAAVNGVAAGAGMSLALASDYCIGGTGARFKRAYTSMGLAPDGGWTAIVPFVVGAARAQARRARRSSRGRSRGGVLAPRPPRPVSSHAADPPPKRLAAQGSS